MRARSIIRTARSSMPQSQATATFPRDPSARATSFHPVPLHSGQLSRAIASTALIQEAGRSLADGHSIIERTHLVREFVTEYELATLTATPCSARFGGEARLLALAKLSFRPCLRQAG